MAHIHQIAGSIPAGANMSTEKGRQGPSQPTGIKVKTDAAKTTQQRRTHGNKIRKYTRLLEKHPESSQAPIWRKKLEYSKNKT